MATRPTNRESSDYLAHLRSKSSASSKNQAKGRDQNDKKGFKDFDLTQKSIKKSRIISRQIEIGEQNR